MKALLIFTLLLPLAAFSDEDHAKTAMSEGDYKEAIRLYEAEQPRRGEVLATLAELYYLDQDHARAYESFLLALDHPSSNAQIQPSANEQALYDEAFKLYLDPQGLSFQEAAQQILETYGSAVVQHPDYYKLSFPVALAYANLNAFQKFFSLFYQAYVHYPDHYLIEKTKALLNIKLYELAATPELKDQYLQKIHANLHQAIQRYPGDTNLYKMAILFSPPADKEKTVAWAINQMIDQNIQVPRHEILFYVGNAIDVKLSPLAQQFINKAKVWYPYSRAINTAQDYLDQKH